MGAELHGEVNGYESAYAGRRKMEGEYDYNSIFCINLPMSIVSNSLILAKENQWEDTARNYIRNKLEKMWSTSTVAEWRMNEISYETVNDDNLYRLKKMYDSEESLREGALQVQDPPWTVEIGDYKRAISVYRWLT